MVTRRRLEPRTARCPHGWPLGASNGLLRQYLPKGSDLGMHSAHDLAAVEDRLNNRPRKTLGWMTPAQVLAARIQS